VIDAIVGFVALLRKRGIGVGSDRAVLAARAVLLTDLTDRDATRRALRATLLLHESDRELFDGLFDLWFASAPFDITDLDVPGSATDSDAAAAEPTEPRVALEASAAPDAYVDDPSEQVAVAADDPSPKRRGSGAEAAPSQAETVSRFGHSDAIGDPDASTPADTADRTEAADADMAAIALPDADTGLDDIAALRRLLDDARFARDDVLGAPARPASALRPNSVLANPFDRDEQRDLDAVVRSMWPQLVGAAGWRRRPSPGGQLDLRRTLRSVAASGGVPVTVRRRAPVTNRPDVLVLIDTSVSMRPSVRLMLHLAHALRRRPGRIRVLGFVDECVDVTDVIRHGDLAVALGGLLDDAPGGPLDPARPSDYGAALTSLWHRYRRLLRSSTTVLVLGDGRSNGRDPGLQLVTDLTARCRRTVWCSPEPAGAWSFGNGEMAAYAARVDVAVSVRSLADLSAAVDRGEFADLVDRPRRRPA